MKFALFGCGRIIRKHIECFSYLKDEGISLVAVADIDVKKADSLATALEVRSFASVSDTVNNCSFDVGVVLTESGNHYPVARELILARKHVIVEKPICLRLEHAEELVSLAEQFGVRIFTVKQNRYNKPVVKLKEAIDNKRLGQLNIGTVRVRWSRDQSYYDAADWRGTWLMDGGALTNQACHHVDLLLYTMGPVRRVFAFAATRGAVIEAEDSLVACVQFESGALGTIEVTTTTRPKDLEGSLSILGSGGSIEIAGFAVNKLICWEFIQGNAEDESIKHAYSENPPNVYGFGHLEFYKSVIESLKSGSDHPLEGDAGVTSLRLIHAIYESVETGLVIDVDRDQTFENCRLGR